MDVIFKMLPQILTLLQAATTQTNLHPVIPKWLGILATVLQQGEGAISALIALREQIETMRENDREPTEDEWRTLLQRSDLAHMAIQAEIIE